MTNVRKTFGLGATFCVLAITAAPAMATEFTASKTGETKGVGLGVQLFKFKPISIKCTAAKSKGKVTALKSATLIDEVSFSKCTAFTTPVAFATPVQFELGANGTFKILNTVKIKVSAIKCTITLEPQRVPASTASKQKPVSYSDEIFKKPGDKKFEKEFPNGQKKLIIATKVAKEGIHYSLEGGFCSELEEKSGEEGKYSGELRDELIGGELGV
jgi:hypothetical protein